MNVSVIIELSEKFYIKDPQSTILGRKIITESIRQIDKWGLETFTFKSLSLAINSTEASIYRYFANKYKLLVYLTCLYWGGMAYQISFHTTNVTDPLQKLKIIISLLATGKQESVNNSYIGDTYLDQDALVRIVARESLMVYIGKEQLQPLNEYQLLCRQTEQIVREINPHYPYASALVDTLFKLTYSAYSSVEHTCLTSEKDTPVLDKPVIGSFLEHLVFSSLFHPNIPCNHG